MKGIGLTRYFLGCYNLGVTQIDRQKTCHTTYQTGYEKNNNITIGESLLDQLRRSRLDTLSLATDRKPITQSQAVAEVIRSMIKLPNNNPISDQITQIATNLTTEYRR
jgi:hypothetical protein